MTSNRSSDDYIPPTNRKNDYCNPSGTHHPPYILSATICPTLLSQGFYYSEDMVIGYFGTCATNRYQSPLRKEVKIRGRLTRHSVRNLQIDLDPPRLLSPS